MSGEGEEKEEETKLEEEVEDMEEEEVVHEIGTAHNSVAESSPGRQRRGWKVPHKVS